MHKKYIINGSYLSVEVSILTSLIYIIHVHRIGDNRIVIFYKYLDYKIIDI